MKKIIIAVVSLSIWWALDGCSGKRIDFVRTVEFPSGNWPREEVPSFTYRPAEDGNKDFYIYLANTDDYPYSNIYLIVRTDKNGKLFVDTLEYEMADGRGRWLGVKTHNEYENLLVFKWNVPVKKDEQMKFEIEQATRKNENLEGDAYLPGIRRVGIMIKPHHSSSTK